MRILTIVFLIKLNKKLLDEEQWNMKYSRLSILIICILVGCSACSNVKDADNQKVITQKTEVQHETIDSADDSEDLTEAVSSSEVITETGSEVKIEETRTEEPKMVSGISRFYGYDLPLLFVVDYDMTDDGIRDYNSSGYVIDNGDSYKVKGTLFCLENIPNQQLYDIKDEVGAQYTSGSGRIYTVQGEESYNNDQRQKVIFSCSDGKTYEIVNIPAFEMDEYGRTFNTFVDSDGNSFRTGFKDVEINIPKSIELASWLNSAISGEAEDYDIAFDIRFAEDGDIDMLESAQTFWIKEWTDENTKWESLD